MGAGAGLYNVRCRRKKFAFAMSSPDEFLLKVERGLPGQRVLVAVRVVARKSTVGRFRLTVTSSPLCTTT